MKASATAAGYEFDQGSDAPYVGVGGSKQADAGDTHTHTHPLYACIYSNLMTPVHKCSRHNLTGEACIYIHIPLYTVATQRSAARARL
jgi:hypothetical protein